MSFKLLFNRRSLLISRNISRNVGSDPSGFVVVYRWGPRGGFAIVAWHRKEPSVARLMGCVKQLPQIFIGSILNKFKKIQLYATSTLVPASYGAFLGNFCDMDIVMSVSTIGVASTIGIFSVGQLFTRTIGFVYLSNNGEKVKISYIDFWGRRKDETINTEEILPLSHSPRYFTDRLYRKIFLTNSVKPLKLVTKLGEVTDNEGFRCALSLNDDESVLD